MPALYFPHGDFGPACDALNPNQVVRSGDPDIDEPTMPVVSSKPTCPIMVILSQYRPAGQFGPVCDISWPDLDPNCLRDNGPGNAGDPDAAAPDGREGLFDFDIASFDDNLTKKFGLRCKYDPILDQYYDCEVEGIEWDPCVIQYGRWAGTNICSRIALDFDRPPRFYYQKPPWEPKYCVDFDPPENVIEYGPYGVKKYVAYARSEPPTYEVHSKHWKEDVNKYAVWVNPMVCNLHGVLQEVTYSVDFPISNGTTEVPKSKPRTFAVEHPAWSTFFNTYGVFIDSGNTTANWNNSTWTVEWDVSIPADSTYTFTFVADNSATIFIDNSALAQFYTPTNCSGTSCWEPTVYTTPLTSGGKKIRAEVINFNDGPDWQSNPTAFAMTIKNASGTVIWDSRSQIGTTSIGYNNEYTMLCATDDDLQVIINNDLKLSTVGCSACHGFQHSEPAQLSGVPTSMQLWDPNQETWISASTGTYPNNTADPFGYYDDERQYWHDWFSANPSRSFVEVLCRTGNVALGDGSLKPLVAGARGIFICNGCGLNTYGPNQVSTPLDSPGLSGKVTIRADRYTKSNGDYGARIYLTRWASFGYNYRDGDVYQLVYTDTSNQDLVMGYIKFGDTITDSFDLKNSVQQYVTVGLPGETSGQKTVKIRCLNTGGVGDQWTSFFPSNNLGEYDSVGMSVVTQTSGPVQSNTELRGFSVPGDGWKYIMTGDWGNTFVENRRIKFNLDTSGASQMRFWVRAGSDENGHERPNNADEGLRLEIDNGTSIVPRTIQLIPAAQGAGFADYENKYGHWMPVLVDLQADERVPSCTFTIKTRASDPPEYRGSEYDKQYPNGGDIYGIYRVDVGGGLGGFVGDQGTQWDSNPACWAIKIYNGPDFSSDVTGIPTKIGVHQFHPDRNPTKLVTYQDGAYNGGMLEFEHGNDVFTTGAAGNIYYQDYTLGNGGLKIRLGVLARCGNSNCSEMDSSLAVVDVLSPGYGYSVGDEFTLTFNSGNKSGSMTDFSVYIAEVGNASASGDLFWHTRMATGFDKYPAP